MTGDDALRRVGLMK